MILLVLILCVIILAGPGAFLLRWGLKLLRTMRQVAREGVVTNGTVENTHEVVTRTHTSNGGSYNRSYYATVAYAVEGQTYSHEMVITRNHFQNWTKNMPIQVQYLPSDPQKAFLPEDHSTQRTSYIMLFAGALLLLFALIMLVATITMATQGRLG